MAGLERLNGLSLRDVPLGALLQESLEIDAGREVVGRETETEVKKKKIELDKSVNTFLFPRTSSKLFMQNTGTLSSLNHGVWRSF